MNQASNEQPSKLHVKSYILDAVLETMQDFHAIGLADNYTMHQFNNLCIQAQPSLPFN